MRYIITIGNEDQPGSGWIDDLDVALGRARAISDRVSRRPQWDGADVRVWEAASAAPGPRLDRLVARFEDGERRAI